jgi:hypothetical protein
VRLPWFRRRRLADVGAPSGSVYLSIRTRTGQRWFELNAIALTPLVAEPALTPADRIIRWSDEDQRLAGVNRLSQAKAESELARVHNAEYSVINLSRTGVIYATPSVAVHGSIAPSVPLSLLLDQLRPPDAQVTTPQLYWLRLQGPNTLILGLIGMHQGIHQSDPAMNPLAREEQVRRNALAQVVGADRVFPEALLGLAPGSDAHAERAAAIATDVDVARLWQLAITNTQWFPREAMLWGRPASRVQNRMLGCALALATLVMGGIVHQQWQLLRLRDAASLAERDARAAIDTLNEQVAQRSDALAQALSLVPTRLFDAADQVWRPGTTLQLDAQQQRTRLVLTLPVQRPVRAAIERRTTISATPKEEFDRWLRIPPPRGWQQESISLRGDFDAYVIAYTQGPTDSDLGAFIDTRVGSVSHVPSPTTPGSTAGPTRRDGHR